MVQVNLFQKHLFLHQLTHNITKDCSLNSKVRTCWVHKLFWMSKQKPICVHNMFWAWNYHVLNWWFNEQTFLILWVIWCKNKGFWQGLTRTYLCTYRNSNFVIVLSTKTWKNASKVGSFSKLAEIFSTALAPNCPICQTQKGKIFI